MKKSFFMGLMIIPFMLGLISCESTPDKTDRHFIVSTEEGLTLDYTEKGDDGSINEKVIMNKITYEDNVFSINKECSWGESGVKYPEGDYVISGRKVNNLKWENGKAWAADCYNSNNPIMFGNDTLAGIQFGWCTCNVDNKSERIFVIDTKTYLGTEEGGIGGTSYIGTLKEVK